MPLPEPALAQPTSAGQRSRHPRAIGQFQHYPVCSFAALPQFRIIGHRFEKMRNRKVALAQDPLADRLVKLNANLIGMIERCRPAPVQLPAQRTQQANESQMGLPRADQPTSLWLQSTDASFVQHRITFARGRIHAVPQKQFVRFPVLGRALDPYLGLAFLQLGCSTLSRKVRLPYLTCSEKTGVRNENSGRQAAVAQCSLPILHAPATRIADEYPGYAHSLTRMPRHSPSRWWGSSATTLQLSFSCSCATRLGVM